ncbi:hypothetical protein D3C86_1819430 [compost metagenome]
MNKGKCEEKAQWNKEQTDPFRLLINNDFGYSQKQGSDQDPNQCPVQFLKTDVTYPHPDLDSNDTQ